MAATADTAIKSAVRGLKQGHRTPDQVVALALKWAWNDFDYAHVLMKRAVDEVEAGR